MIHESNDDEDLGKRKTEECFLIVLLRIILVYLGLLISTYGTYVSES